MATTDSYEIEETYEESYVIPLFEIFQYNNVEIVRKAEELFRKVIVSFNRGDPLTNFINRQEGPLLNTTEHYKKHYPGIVEENGDLAVYLSDLKIPELYCPICGEKVESDYLIQDIFTKAISDNPYLKRQDIFLAGETSDEKAKPKNIYFNYISCKHCLSNIELNYNKNGRPLHNEFLYDLYERMGKHFGFVMDKDKNKLNRCLYPTDRMFFEYNGEDGIHKIFYFNLFHLTDYGFYKFEQYFKEHLKVSEEEFDEGRILVFTKHAINQFEPEKSQKYIDFYAFLKDEMKKEMFTEDFIVKQIKGFRFKIDSADFEKEKDLKVLCTKDCQNCTKNLCFPKGIDQLFEYIPKRRSEQLCEAKQFLIKEEIEAPQEEKKMPIYEEGVQNDTIQTTIQNNEEHNSNDSQLSSENMERGISEGMGRSREGDIELPVETNVQQDNGIILEEGSNLNVIQEESKIIESNSENKTEKESLPINDHKDRASSSKNEESKSDEIWGRADNQNTNNTESLEKESYSKIDEEDLEIAPKVLPSTRLPMGDEEPLELNQEQKKQDIDKGKDEPLVDESDEQMENILKKDNSRAKTSITPIETEAVQQEKMEEPKKTLKQILLEVFPPIKDDLIFIYKELPANLSEERKFNLALNRYAEWVAKGLIDEINKPDGKDILKVYPEINYDDLLDLVFKVQVREDAERIRAKENQINDALNNQSINVKYDKDPSGNESIDNRNGEYLEKIRDKEKSQIQKNAKISSRMLFNTPDVKANIPFVLNKTLEDEYQHSVFRPVFDIMLKIDGYKAGTPITTIRQDAYFIPIVDFPDVGVRFICVNTEDTRYRIFTYNPLGLAKKVPFPNKKFAKSYSINVVYSNECITNPHQVAYSMFKIVNANFMDKDHVVRLAGRDYPLAYSTEKRTLRDFEEKHSIFSGLGRVADKRVTLIAFVEDDQNSVLAQQKRLAEKAIRGMNFRNTTIRELLDKFQIYLITSAHYMASEEYEVDSRGNRYPYMLYTITQYTENIYTIIEDGFPATVSAIIAEHYREARERGQQALPYAIVYQYDRTALVSPSVRKLIAETRGIFEVDPTSRGQGLYDTVTSWVISESRFKQNNSGTLLDDRARYDYRLFEASDTTFREMLRNKIRNDEDVRDRARVLMSCGFVRYPEPKTMNYNITDAALDQLEHSNLYRSLMHLELDKINQTNQFDRNVNNTVIDLLATKFMMQNNINIEGSENVLDLLEGSARIVGAVRRALRQNKQQ